MTPLERIQSQINVINEALEKVKEFDVGDASAEEYYYKHNPNQEDFNEPY